MNKGELVKALSESADMTRSDAAKAIDCVFDIIATAIKSGDSVSIVGFGSFSPKTKAAREVRNPATGEKMQVPQRTTAAFKPSAALKDI